MDDAVGPAGANPMDRVSNQKRRSPCKEIATREGIDNSYVSRMVNLTTLAPDIVAAILDDTQRARLWSTTTDGCPGS